MTTINQRNRGLPFLHRNWLKATNHWSKMGNKVSSQSRDSTDIAIDRDDNAGHGRVSKRRRLDNQYDGFPLYEDYGKTQRALRIEVLKVSHKDSPRVKNGITNGLVPPHVRDVTQIKARCKLSICGHQNGQMAILHVDSQVCDIRIFKNPAGSAPMARFYAIKPFHIPEEKIYVERDDDASFGLANSYSVVIELESAGDMNWPPRELVPVTDDDSYYGRGLPPRKWQLTASIGDVFSARNRKTMRLRVRKQPDQELNTNFLMDVDVRWLTAVSSQLVMKEHTKDIMPSIVVQDENAPPKTAVNGNIPGSAPLITNFNGILGHRAEPLVNGEVEKLVNGHVNGSIPDIPDDLAEGEITPGRSRRARQDVNYNVKQMMNIALGKETRKRRKFGEEQPQLDEHTITYLLPPEQVQTERFACLLCGAENERLSQLRAHYSSHPQYEFIFESHPRRGYCVTVKPSSNGNGAPLRPVVYQLGLPVQPLDMDKFVNGDDSWLMSRLGPEDGRDITLSNQLARPQLKSFARGAKKKVLVPVTKQQLFDPYSKVPLYPGEEVPEHPIDDGWLLLKHRENLEDFIDLTPVEKDYLQEWDAFILRKHLSSEQYLPRNLLRFVQERSMWLVAKKSRTEEFSKHMSTLMARRILPDATVMEITQILNDARTKMKNNPAAAAAAAEPTQPTKKKTTGGCCTICLEPVPVPSMLICANKRCNNRLYHNSCVKNPEAAMAMEDEWKCTDCA